NLDGLSDISGRACGSSTSTTTSEDTGVTVPAVDSGIYDITVETPLEQDWVGLVSGYMTNNPMISTIQGTGFELTDAQCSFSVQIYGKTATIDFCALSSWLDVFGFLFVGLCALRSVFMAMGVD
ncbi:MAG: hypothetical protein NUW09_04200, partial [Deltaproteobacteria bacterium]|nr:hypothetical protein [Deltaproteobacteria bacterium]